MASQVGICNRALQILGAERITTLTDNSRNARACVAAYDAVRQAELRKHTWNFSVARAELAADADEPAWGRANAFTLPAACLRLLPAYPEDNLNSLDWQIEGRKILTDDSAPIYVRYVDDITDANTMDALFREALSARLAYDLCEEITQSNSKQDLARERYTDAIREARKVNAFERVSAESPDDVWITARL
jgi:hypothetical protein